MANENDAKLLKKPIPLPRKSLLKHNKSPLAKESENESEINEFYENKPEEGNFVRDNWRSASENFGLLKSKFIKNEVQKFEKSVRSIISRSSNSKCQTEFPENENSKSASAIDNTIFYNISFKSPLSANTTNNCIKDVYYDDTSLPPPYPPPDLPDESVYDQMRTFNSADSCLLKSLGSDTDISNRILSIESSSITCNENERLNKVNTSTMSSQKNIGESFNSEECLKTTFDSKSCCSKENEIYEEDLHSKSHIKYIINLFDPLRENSICCENRVLLKSNIDSLDLSSNIIVENLNSNLVLNNNIKIENNPKILEISPSILQEGNYGKIKKVPNSAKHSEMIPTKSLDEPPPIPPRSFNKSSPTLIETKKEDLAQTELLDFNEDIPVNKSVEERPKVADVMQWSSLKRVARKVADNLETRKSSLTLSVRKSIKHPDEDISANKSVNRSKPSFGDICQLPQNFPKHSGNIIKAGGTQRWGVLSQKKLTLFATKDSPDVKETVPMENVLSVQVTQNKISNETVGVHCFEISLSSKNQRLLFGVPSISERHIWMRKLLESIGPGFSAKLSMDYDKAGWCFAKESVSSVWAKYFILLRHRTLYLTCEGGSSLTADLRKARKITLQSEDFACEKVTEKGPFLLVDLQDKTFYLQMDYERETKAWESTLMAAALKNGPSLCEQQLTKDNVPTIVHKCLNFIHTNGSFSEGIYRRSGSNRTVSQLLASFRCNAWSVHLTKDVCSEFDVSSVLKRFFRDLPEPLLIPEIQPDLSRVSSLINIKEKVEQYKKVLKKLPEINYKTATKLLCHLHFIDKQKDKNLMGAENLASIWGPTILQIQEKVSLDSNCFKLETVIVNDLICYCPEICEIDQAEVDREMKILQMLESYHINSNNLNKKPSGELKIWVYLHSAHNVDNCFNVSINPHKTAEEVCKELVSKTNESLLSLCLQEVVCNGHLVRPLHSTEKVLDTVLRWSYWDEVDRKDNCLVLAKNDIFQQVLQCAKYPIIFSEELKFADQKSKTFKTCLLEFSQAKLICFKDKTCSQKMGEWKIEDIVWYFGHEPKRTPHMKWSLTFIDKQLITPRRKDKPYFGNTIAGSSEEQKLKLVTDMLIAQYPNTITPTFDLIK